MNQQMNLLEARAVAREREHRHAPAPAAGVRPGRTTARGAARLLPRARSRAARHGARPAQAITARG